MHAFVALAVVRFGLQLAVGAEYDSNANRAEIVANPSPDATPDTPVGSFLLRTTANAHLLWRTHNNLVRLSAGLGGKVFFNPAVFDQDVLALSVNGEDRVRALRWLHFAVVGDYYDAWQLDVAPNRHLDFRSGSALGRVYFTDELGEVALSAGYRGFQFKPDPYFDFQALQGTAFAVTRLHFGAEQEHELDVAATYHFEHRYYNGVVEEFAQNDNPFPPPGQSPDPTKPLPCAYGHDVYDGCLVAGTDQRVDWWNEGGIETTYVGPVLVALGYGLQLNKSNSFGQSLLRHLITLKVAYRFPWNLYATLKGQLYITKYLDPVLLDRNVNTQTFISIEDENRNAVIVDVEKPVGHGLALDARYSVYTNELTSSPVSFLRQIVYLGLTYRVGAR